MPELRGTGSYYFAAGKSPQNISIKAGTQTAESKPILVRKDAKAEQGEPTLEFPEALLLIAYLAGASPVNTDTYSLIVTVLPPRG
jgi:hypothetical protein